MSTQTWTPRLEVYYNKASNNTLKWGPFTVDGVAITSGATATVAIGNPSGTAIVTATAMTAALPYFTYSINTSSATSYPLDEGYTADIVVTYSANTYNYRVIFDVVRQPFVCMVTDTDLAAYIPTASDRKGTLTSYSAQILAAFEEVKGAIICKGQRPALIFDPNAFRTPIIYRTLAICAEGIWRKEVGDRWEESRDFYMEQYKVSLDRALEAVSLRSDIDEDGLLSEAEKETYLPVRLML
jgi:hypothetical protein